jgi:outer membrane protein assembly factor BamB
MFLGWLKSLVFFFCALQKWQGDSFNSLFLSSKTRHLLQKILTAIFALTLLSACDKDQEYDKTKAISAFAAIDPIKLDPALEKVEISLPPQQQNDLWKGSGSLQNQRVENIAKNFSLKNSFFSFGKSHKISLKKASQFWSFYTGASGNQFLFYPIVKDEKIFLLDPSAELVAYDMASSKTIWKQQVFEKKILKNYRAPKIGYYDGKIFAVAGVNKIAAVSEVDGKILWSKNIASIPVSAPVSDGAFVYVSTNDNKLYAFNSSDGELQWVQSGIVRATAIFGAADLVINKDLIIVSYSSGEIYAVKRKTGEAVWSQNLNVNKATNSDFYLNDIDATPLVKNDVVYSIGNGGLMMAIDAKTGNYLWKKEIAGIVDFWLAGEFLFVVNNDNQLLAISKKTGGIKWISQLPNFVKEKNPATKILYNGVLMAGDHLLVSSVHGEILIVSPFDGKIEQTFSVGKKISHSPVVVKDKIYVYAMGKFTLDLIEIR